MEHYYEDRFAALGLEYIGEADLSEPNYSFDLIGAWKGRDGIYISTDSGCSCPSPWENHGQLEDFTGPLTAEQAIQEATNLWAGEDGSGYGKPHFDAFISDIKEAAA